MRSWISPRAEKRASHIEGRGLFARESIAAGAIVAVKAGAIIDGRELERLHDLISPAEIQIEDDLWIAPLDGSDVEANLLCLNHSCEPNVGVRGQITFVTIRAVESGEELTIDYAMIDGDPRERMECACGTPSCRSLITGDDWRREDLQRRYRGHFSRYLQERINRM